MNKKIKKLALIIALIAGAFALSSCYCWGGGYGYGGGGYGGGGYGGGGYGGGGYGGGYGGGGGSCY